LAIEGGQIGNSPVTKLQLLEALRFGARVAEDEADDLEKYFIETDQWKRIFSDEVDIVYGAKGSGKSAIYALINRRANELFDRNILLSPAENPRGATVFGDLVSDPPPNERSFIALWKLYFVSLIAKEIRNYDLVDIDSQQFIASLEEAGLLPKQSTLPSLFQAVRSYIIKYFDRDRETIEHSISYDPSTSMPIVTRRVKYQTRENLTSSPPPAIPADALLSTADTILANSNYSVWLVIDRLDVAFVESRDLEKNALRALFRVYNDMRALSNVRVKIFVRNDIWRRITEGGFTEASHITRAINIRWDHSSLLNLVVRRLLSNRMFVEYYVLKVDALLDRFNEQETLVARIFPDQIDTGRNPRTFGWILARTQDASGESAPREIIHLLDAARDAQVSRISRGETEPEGDLRVVSHARYNQTLLAEYPEWRTYLQALVGGKAEQTVDSLADLWNVDHQKAIEIANELHEIGFFENRGTRDEPTYWTPFLYRDALQLVQGRAE
jgi:hypothetical protein